LDSRCNCLGIQPARARDARAKRVANVSWTRRRPALSGSVITFLCNLDTIAQLRSFRHIG
jgi:hypothetical protein